MQRWLVAGGVLALLVGMILYDEFGSAPVDNGAPAAVASPDGAVVQPDMQAMLQEELDDDEAREPDDPGARTADCDHMIAVLTAKGGQDYMEAVGEKLIDEQGMEVAALDAICRDLKGSSDEAILAKMAELSGLSPE